MAIIKEATWLNLVELLWLEVPFFYFHLLPALNPKSYEHHCFIGCFVFNPLQPLISLDLSKPSTKPSTDRN